MEDLRVYYVTDKKLISECDRIPAVKGRASMVQSLISSYDLFHHVRIRPYVPASFREMRLFHSEAYLEYLRGHEMTDDSYMPTNEDELYGLAYDCPPVAGMYDMVSTIAGASIAAARLLMRSRAYISVNWCGGWHHAKRSSANGYFYVNDVVLAIETLKEWFNNILYVDLDNHHGDGVQNAYYSRNDIFTLSFHTYVKGFFPGSGSIDEIGVGPGKGYTCNFPFLRGYNDNSMNYVFEKVFNMVFNKFKPNVVVVQCGADSLSFDPKGSGKLTQDSYCKAVQVILNKKKPTLLLGGGGFDNANAARLWTYLLALTVGVTLDDMIVDDTYWPKYNPTYSLFITASRAKDFNTKAYLDKCINTIEDNLKYCDEVYESPAYSPHQPEVDGYGSIPAKVKRIFKSKQKKARIPPEEPTTSNFSVYDMLDDD